MLKVARLLAPGSRILDVGAGDCSHAEWFRSKGFIVYTVDFANNHTFVGDFNEIWSTIRDIEGFFDCVWSSHVLEHQKNPGRFLEAVRSLTETGGLIAITVPPRKDRLVGGHLSLYTPLSLIYNMILAGLDCSGASVKVEGYNISVVVRNTDTDLPWDLAFDRGDIEKLAHLFPVEVRQGTAGFSLTEINW